MTVNEKVQLANTFVGSPAIWEQFDKKNAPQFAMAGAIGDKTIQTSIFTGQELIKNKIVKLPSREDYIGDFNDMVEGVYGARDSKAILDSALSIYAANSDAAIEGNYDSGDFEQAIRDATGGIGNINGFNLELPRNVDQDDFEEYIDFLQPQTIIDMGGIQNFDDDQAIDAIQESKIQSIGANQYVIIRNGMTLFSKKNPREPFIFSYSKDQADENKAGSIARANASTRASRARR
jgi:hypothetical protein